MSAPAPGSGALPAGGSASLVVEVAGGVATVTIDRPRVLNALDRATLLELDAALVALGGREDVRAVVLTGAGEKAFVAGADIAEMAGLTPDRAREYALLGQAVLARLERLPKPVVAAINGFALGGGCELALAATLRLAAENAELGQPEVNLGLIPGFGGTQRLARLVGKGRALELILTGARVKAAEALAMGLVNRVVPQGALLEESRALAGRLAEKAPLAVRYALEAVGRGLEDGLEAGLRLEATLFGLVFASEDMKEGTRAFLEKRRPEFRGR